MSKTKRQRLKRLADQIIKEEKAKREQRKREAIEANRNIRETEKGEALCFAFSSES